MNMRNGDSKRILIACLIQSYGNLMEMLSCLGPKTQ